MTIQLGGMLVIGTGVVAAMPRLLPPHQATASRIGR